MSAEQHTAATERLRLLCALAGIAVSLAGYIRASDAARLLGVTTRTLRTWRYDGSGPPATRIGGGHWYALDALAAYLARKKAEESGRVDIDAVAEPASSSTGNSPLKRHAQ